MQQLAAEMNLSETAYLWREGDAYRLRWFTPEKEAKLCGHATLASSHVLWEQGLERPDARLHFETMSGTLFATRADDGITLDFPLEIESEIPAPRDLVAALGREPSYVGSTGEKFLVEYETEQEVRELQPDFEALRRLSARSVMVTARSSTSGFDFVSRYFAPKYGIPEDPVTGSAHSCLGPHWQKRLGKSSLVAYQASRRGGILRLTLRDARIFITGHAVTIWRGALAEAVSPSAS
jgi:PhzF family phenazine biosynthesis protein